MIGYRRNPSAYDDDWEDQPAQSWFHQYVLGVALPLLLIAYGVIVIATQEANLGNRVTYSIHGMNAFAWGMAWLSAGLFVHCHYYWGNIYDQAWFAVLGKIISGVGFAAGMIVLLIRSGILGIR